MNQIIVIEHKNRFWFYHKKTGVCDSSEKN